MRLLSRSASAILVLATIAGCNGAKNADGSGAPPAPSASAASSSQPASPEQEARRSELLLAEHLRAASKIEDTDLASRARPVRVAAARALARISGPSAHDKLLRALSDEDAEVVAWAAYGLGFDCAATRDATVDALVARAISLPESDAFDAAFASIARAVGACASPMKSEATLVAWLGAKPARAAAAALGLGDLAGRSKKLLEETWVSLFARAEGSVSTRPLPEALYAVTRVENVPPSVLDRLATVAAARLAEPGPYRLHAIRALGRAKGQGLSALEPILVGDAKSFTMPERVEAARAAARLGPDGQVLIGKLLEQAATRASALLERPPEAMAILAALRALVDPKAAPKALTTFAAMPVPNGAPPRARRIASLLRCAAARVAPDTKPTDATLLACDVDKGWIGKVALTEVLGRAEMGTSELATFKRLVSDTDARVREAALELLSSHLEVSDSPSILAAALRAREPGVVTTAAEQIHKAPLLATARAVAPKKKPKEKEKDKDKGKGRDPKKDPEPSVVTAPVKDVENALVAALDRAEHEQDMEMLGSVLDGIGALGQKSLVSRVLPFCQSDQPTAREHASNALALLGTKKPGCEAPASAASAVPEASAPAKRDVAVELDTDAGKLRIDLDASRAPVLAARIEKLVARGYFDGNVIHRVDPSYVVQFGSPEADGYAGPPDLPPLRCETSPDPFQTLDVGVALSGRDTGSSQLFVMRGRFPHLDGMYPWVGRASGPWEEVVEGDTIRKATLVAP